MGFERAEMELRVNHKTLQQEVVSKLRDAIFAGVFQPGDRLVEVELSRSMGVSRPSLREAMRSLAAERLIEIVPNRGPYVPILSWTEVDAIYQVRLLLEVEAVGLATRNLVPSGIAALEKALEAFDHAAANDGPRGRIEATSNFYDIIFNYCGNPIIVEILNGLLARINFLRSRSMKISDRAQQSSREMRDMLAALREGDETKARHACKNHIIRARNTMKNYFAANPDLRNA